MSGEEFKEGDLVEFVDDDDSTLIEITYSDDKEIEAYILLSDDKSLEGATAYPNHSNIKHASDEILEKYKEYL